MRDCSLCFPLTSDRSVTPELYLKELFPTEGLVMVGVSSCCSSSHFLRTCIHHLFFFSELSLLNCLINEYIFVSLILSTMCRVMAVTSVCKRSQCLCNPRSHLFILLSVYLCLPQIFPQWSILHLIAV